MARLLLTIDEGYGPLAAVRGLHAAGHETWLAVSQRGTYAERSRAGAGTVWVTAPSVDAGDHAREVAEAADRLGAAAVLPGTEASLSALTEHEGLFRQGPVVGVTSEEVLERATDKRRLGGLARRAGLAAPETVEVRSADEDHLALHHLPAVVKPLRSVEAAGDALIGRMTELVRTERELRRALEGAPGVPCLVQPYIRGTLAAVCGVAWEGELVCAMHQRSPRIWPPDRGISAYAISVPPDPSHQGAVEELVRGIGWSGVFGVQLLLSEGRAQVIDFNPRIYGSLALAVASGLNLPAIWAAQLLGEPVRVPDTYRVGTHYRAEEDDPRALLAAFRRGERPEALRGLLPRRRTVHAVFSWRDPAPSLVTLGKLVRRRRAGDEARS